MWVALFLAHLRFKYCMTHSNLNFVVQHTSSLISDIASRLQSKTMSLFHQFGLDQSQGKRAWDGVLRSS